MKYYLAIKKNEIMSFTTTWMDKEIITQSEMSKTNIIFYCLSVESRKWYKWTYFQHRNRLTGIENKLMFTKGGNVREIN